MKIFFGFEKWVKKLVQTFFHDLVGNVAANIICMSWNLIAVDLHACWRQVIVVVNLIQAVPLQPIGPCSLPCLFDGRPTICEMNSLVPRNMCWSLVLSVSWGKIQE